MCTHNLCFEQKQEKYENFSAENFQFLKLKKSLFIAWACFHNVKSLQVASDQNNNENIHRSLEWHNIGRFCRSILLSPYFYLVTMYTSSRLSITILTLIIAKIPVSHVINSHVYNMAILERACC